MLCGWRVGLGGRLCVGLRWQRHGRLVLLVELLSWLLGRRRGGRLDDWLVVPGEYEQVVARFVD